MRAPARLDYFLEMDHGILGIAGINQETATLPTRRYPKYPKHPMIPFPGNSPTFPQTGSRPLRSLSMPHAAWR